MGFAIESTVITPNGGSLPATTDALEIDRCFINGIISFLTISVVVIPFPSSAFVPKGGTYCGKPGTLKLFNE
jgi:hypothetical protein